jgi:hypothetical protein
MAFGEPTKYLQLSIKDPGLWDLSVWKGDQHFNQ